MTLKTSKYRKNIENIQDTQQNQTKTSQRQKHEKHKKTHKNKLKKKQEQTQKHAKHTQKQTTHQNHHDNISTISSHECRQAALKFRREGIRSHGAFTLLPIRTPPGAAPRGARRRRKNIRHLNAKKHEILRARHACIALSAERVLILCLPSCLGA